MIRQRSTRSTAGSGPRSTIAFSEAICPSLSLGERPGKERLNSPAIPCAS